MTWLPLSSLPRREVRHTPGAGHDDLNGATYPHEIYVRADPAVSGRATVPVLWDKQRDTIVNNESADILRMLNPGFGNLADESLDLYPADLRTQIDAANARIYPGLNNGVYRAGFATTQAAYDEAFALVFATLDALEAELGDGRAWLPGERFTEADVRLFVTLVRFDAAYYKRGYYSIKALNPNAIVPLGPALPGLDRAQVR